MRDLSAYVIYFQQTLKIEVPKIGRYSDMSNTEKLSINTLALVGEAGELANKLKKHIWYAEKTEADLKAELIDELGDVLYHVTQLASELDIYLEEMMEQVLAKMEARNKG